MALLQEILARSASQHRHLCPRQVLGARIGLAAAEALGVSLPPPRRRLYVFVETDGCFADGIAAATGCTLGHRTMRLVDLGRVAATVVDLRTRRAVRAAPRPQIRQRALEVSPGARSGWHAQLDAYQRLPVEELLTVRPVALTVALDDLLGRASARVTCAGCEEEVINGREVVVNGRILCRACAGDTYYHEEIA
ncbi:MAG: FmdE family protein [Armatimonadota bacterium]|nr:FmdE family protein [Armatimonadota bacterium]MDR7450587.1 FmdE family protein [Armatimonadota bacterium]MDR7466280.1 FmdE family protein [Armatimonadota bacterium]MDR7493001.1 FmdE family protein [Armatimonadota bacterium]MDR7498242.1 FmdE family protein [Armatimonadota bacterium]